MSRKVLTARSVLALFGLVLAGVAASYMLQANRPLGQYVGDTPGAMRLLEDKESPQVGRSSSDLTVLAFTDYQCAACRKTNAAMLAAIARDGNVRLVYKDWPIFGHRSQRAAEVALASHLQGIYPAVHRRLMHSPKLDVTTMRDAVEQAGGNWQQVEDDLVEHQSWIARQLANNSLEALRLGLEGTPGYLVGPFLIQGALSEREFLRAFSQARAKSRSR